MASGESCQQSTNHQGARGLLRLEATNLEVLAMVFLGVRPPSIWSKSFESPG